MIRRLCTLLLYLILATGGVTAIKPDHAIAVDLFEIGTTNFDAFAEELVKRATAAHSISAAAYTNQIPGTKASYAMMPIPGGEFTMGSGPGERFALPSERPRHRVRLAPFWMGKCEVTWNEFNAFVQDELERRQASPPPAGQLMESYLADAITHPSLPYVSMDFGMGRNGFPAIGLTQHAANKYCQWLSAKTGHFYRLPTEAEWEYAARAGTTNLWFFGDDETKLGDYAWFENNSEFKYQKIGRKLPNPWGLHDMLGNVSEWVLDQYDESFYESCSATSVAIQPWNKARRPYPHVVRGGSWRDPIEKVRCAARGCSSPDWKLGDPQLPRSVFWMRNCDFNGFRIVRPVTLPGVEEMRRYWNNGVAAE